MYFRYGKTETEYLRSRDKKLAVAIDKIGHIKRLVNPDLFSSIVSQIIGQQISTAAHQTILDRIDRKIGAITPATICGLTTEEIQKFGMTYRKAEYIKNIAEKTQTGELNMARLKKKNDEDFISELVKQKGLGQWTAEMVLIFCLQRKNILSYKDLAIHRGLRMLHHHEDIDKTLFEKYRNRYAPYNTIASLYLWSIAAGNVG